MILRKLAKITAVTIASITMATAQAAQALETFQIGGFALNTNNNFVKFDTQPIMSSWTHNINDADQQFDILQGARGGKLLRHRSTGKCLNAHYMWNGARMNVWTCNASDPDQNWNLIGVGNGEYLLQRTGTNYCVDMPYRQNSGLVHIIQCNSSNGNQRWKMTTVGTNPPPPSNGGSTIEIPVNWSLAAYRQNNAFWQSGYAPASMNPPVNRLNGALGNCTWYANGRLQQLGYSKYALDSMLGNAYQWDNTASRGVTISFTPRVGAIAQWEGNHVAVVEQVNSNGTILISESSYYTSATSGSVLYRTRTISATNPTRYLIVPR